MKNTVMFPNVSDIVISESGERRILEPKIISEKQMLIETLERIVNETTPLGEDEAEMKDCIICTDMSIKDIAMLEIIKLEMD